MNYEEIISVVKAELSKHVQVGKYDICWCGWQGAYSYPFEDHLAAMIAVRLRE